MIAVDQMVLYLVAAATGLCAIGCAWLLAAGGVGLCLAAPAPDSLPWSLRLLWRPAGIAAACIANVIPARVHERVKRDLARCDLDGTLSPSQWISLRLLQGLLALLVTVSTARTAGWPAAVPGVVALVVALCWGGSWLRQQRLRRATAILRQLPAYLDVLTLCVESGATLTTGMRLAVDKSAAGPLRQVFERVLREIRSGRTRVDAFASVAQVYDLEALSALTSALIHSEGAGMSLGAVLRAQSQQRTAERFATAERLAMQAPVKMLGPLILCIFPCTFVVIAVPIAVRLLGVTSP